MMLISLSSHDLCIPGLFLVSSFPTGPHPGHDDTRFISYLLFLICLTNLRKLLWLQHALTVGQFLGLDSHWALGGTTWDRCLPDKILERTRPLDEILETPKRAVNRVFYIAMLQQERKEKRISWENTPDAPSWNLKTMRPTHKPTPWGQLRRLRGWLQAGVGEGGSLLCSLLPYSALISILLCAGHQARCWVYRDAWEEVTGPRELQAEAEIQTS